MFQVELFLNHLQISVIYLFKQMLQWETNFFVSYCCSAICSDLTSYPDKSIFLTPSTQALNGNRKKTDCSGYDLHLMFTYIF